MLKVKNRSHAITAELVIPDGGANGVLFAQGGVTGGWSLYGYLFSLDETSDVGVDSCSPVCDDYPPGTANAFTGGIKVHPHRPGR